MRKSFFGATQNEARKKMEAAQKLLDEGLPLPNQRETVASYLAAWLSDRAEYLRPRTLASYKMIAELHLIPALGKVKLADLDQKKIREYLKQKRQKLAARTCAYHHSVLRAALAQAERDSIVTRNVARLVQPPRVERQEVRPLSPDDARTLMEAVAESRDAALYVTALRLGLRQGELLGLQWSDIDFNAGTLTVRHTLQRYGHEYHLDNPKTDKSRRVLGLPATLVQLLSAHRRQQLEDKLKAGPHWDNSWDLVFCNPHGKPLPGNWLTHRYQALLERLGLPRQPFHNLRHSAASFMRAEGIDLRVIQEVLGHSTIAVTAGTYVHIRTEATRSAAEAVDALLAR
jgi:integrase